MEVWKDVVGFEGRYEVSNLGNIASFSYRGHAKRELMKQTSNYSGYKVVTLGLSRKQSRVHVLVLEAFVGERPTNLQGCHNDSDKSNNTLSNLRWDTPVGNIADRRSYLGDKNPNSKLTDNQKEQIALRRKGGEALLTIANEFGISLTRVSQLSKVVSKQ